MLPSKSGYAFVAVTVLLAAAISLLANFTAQTSSFERLVRLLALNGYFLLSIAAMMTPFLREMKHAFNRSFRGIHHSYAALGLTLVTLHPVIMLFRSMNLGIFVPSVTSFYGFWLQGGRQALIFIYIALAGALLMRKIPKHWRTIHALIYVALFFALVHAYLLGVDFQNPIIVGIYTVLFAGVIAAFGLKRLQQHRFHAMAKLRQLGPNGKKNNSS